MNKLLLAGMITLMTLGCNKKKDTFSDRVVHIITQSGEPFDNCHFVAAPLTHGVMINGRGDSLDVMVIAKHIEGNLMEVKPLGTFSIIVDTIRTNYILAIPQKQAYQVMTISSFDDFVIRNNAAKVLIDQYYSNCYGLGKSRVAQWQNTNFANRYIDVFMQENQE